MSILKNQYVDTMNPNYNLQDIIHSYAHNIATNSFVNNNLNNNSIRMNSNEFDFNPTITNSNDDKIVISTIDNYVYKKFKCKKPQYHEKIQILNLAFSSHGVLSYRAFLHCINIYKKFGFDNESLINDLQKIFKTLLSNCVKNLNLNTLDCIIKINKKYHVLDHMYKSPDISSCESLHTLNKLIITSLYKLFEQYAGYISPNLNSLDVNDILHTTNAVYYDNNNSFIPYDLLDKNELKRFCIDMLDMVDYSDPDEIDNIINYMPMYDYNPSRFNNKTDIAYIPFICINYVLDKYNKNPSLLTDCNTRLIKVIASMLINIKFIPVSLLANLTICKPRRYVYRELDKVLDNVIKILNACNLDIPVASTLTQCVFDNDIQKLFKSNTKLLTPIHVLKLYVEMLNNCGELTICDLNRYGIIDKIHQIVTILMDKCKFDLSGENNEINISNIQFVLDSIFNFKYNVYNIPDMIINDFIIKYYGENLLKLSVTDYINKEIENIWSIAGFKHTLNSQRTFNQSNNQSNLDFHNDFCYRMEKGFDNFSSGFSKQFSYIFKLTRLINLNSVVIGNILKENEPILSSNVKYVQEILRYVVISAIDTILKFSINNELRNNDIDNMNISKSSLNDYDIMKIKFIVSRFIVTHNIIKFIMDPFKIVSYEDEIHQISGGWPILAVEPNMLFKIYECDGRNNSNDEDDCKFLLYAYRKNIELYNKINFGDARNTFSNNNINDQIINDNNYTNYYYYCTVFFINEYIHYNIDKEPEVDEYTSPSETPKVNELKFKNIGMYYQIRNIVYTAMDEYFSEKG